SSEFFAPHLMRPYRSLKKFLNEFVHILERTAQYTRERSKDRSLPPRDALFFQCRCAHASTSTLPGCSITSSAAQYAINTSSWAAHALNASRRASVRLSR